MNFWLGASVAAATGALFAPLASTAPTRATADGASTVISAAYSRNDALQRYTFHLNVAMTMRHFPWLHFRMEGVGDYQRGDRYVVHLTDTPWFASRARDIDLSMIDPNMWPKRYRYEVVGRQGEDTIFALQSLQSSQLKAATVALNPVTGARWADVTYGDGTHIHMVVTSTEIDGFLLPVTLTASVDYPAMPLSADAAFTDYSITAPAH